MMRGVVACRINNHNIVIGCNRSATFIPRTWQLLIAIRFITYLNCIRIFHIGSNCFRSCFVNMIEFSFLARHVFLFCLPFAIFLLPLPPS